MFDIGANLSHEQFKHDLKAVIERAIASGVKGMLLTSTDWQSFEDNLNVIEQFGTDIFLKTTYGLHPHYAKEFKTILPKINTYLAHEDVAAVGEFGLDYFRMLSSKQTQHHVMESFLQAAQKFSHKPLFLHERDAFEDFLSLLKQAKGNKKVVHCFTGNTQAVRAYLDEDCYIGLTGWISDSRRNADIIKAIEYIPMDKLMIETDCPYLTPFNMPKRPRRNEPAFLTYVAQSISQIKGIGLEEVFQQTSQNTMDFLSLDGYNIKNNTRVLKNGNLYSWWFCS